MFTKRSRLRALLALCMGSLLSFAIGYDGGCYNLVTQSVTDSIVPCAIFDCTGGLLGGAINPCNPNNPIFVGCP